MNIVHASPTYYSDYSIIGGGEKYIIYMIRALSIATATASGPISNCILSFGKASSHHTLQGGIPCHIIKGKPWDPHSIRIDELKTQLCCADIVIVHQCLSSLGLFIASHAQLCGKFVVGMDHGGGLYHLVSHTHEAAGMYNAFWAQSKFASNSFIGLDVRTTVVRGPVDTEFYRPELPSNKDPCLVASVGRLLPHKGFDRIIKSIPARLKLVIAGRRSDDEYFKYLKELQTKSTGIVEIKEDLNDLEIRTLLQKASLFVHASTHIDYRSNFYLKPELLGLAPLEALACGTPSLVSSAGSLAELTVVAGVKAFETDDELTRLLTSHSQNNIVYPTPKEIHTSVDAHYGLSQFGNRIFNELSLRNIHR